MATAAAKRSCTTARSFSIVVVYDGVFFVALVEEDFGSELALRVAQGLVMFLRRPANQSQFSVPLTALSPRTFTRVFAREIGMTPWTACGWPSTGTCA